MLQFMGSQRVGHNLVSEQQLLEPHWKIASPSPPWLGSSCAVTRFQQDQESQKAPCSLVKMMHHVYLVQVLLQPLVKLFLQGETINWMPVVLTAPGSPDASVSFQWSGSADA